MSIRQYTCNLFSYPEDYFTNRTAEELCITELERQEIILMQQNAQRYRDDPEYRMAIQEKRRLEEQDVLKLFEKSL